MFTTPRAATLQTLQTLRMLCLQTLQTRTLMLAEDTYDAVRAREEREPEVVEPVLRLLADPDSDTEVTDTLLEMAALLSEQRESWAVDDVLTASMTTPEVIDRVRSWNDRRTVASARRRGQLLGVQVGRDVYHPVWQFGPSGVRAGVTEIVGRLLEAAAGDELLADQIMRAARPELDGESLIDLLVAGRVDEIRAFLAVYREGFTA